MDWFSHVIFAGLIFTVKSSLPYKIENNKYVNKNADMTFKDLGQTQCSFECFNKNFTHFNTNADGTEKGQCKCFLNITDTSIQNRSGWKFISKLVFEDVVYPKLSLPPVDFYFGTCPGWPKYGEEPESTCTGPTDPLNKPLASLESWFTEGMFGDLFPKANLGWGPSKCSPINYEAFVIAARYFPTFGNEHVTTDPLGGALTQTYTPSETYRRDVAAFLAHAVQITGEHNAEIFSKINDNQTLADNCFFRGGFYNWFQGGPESPYLRNKGLTPEDGGFCNSDVNAQCSASTDTPLFYPCDKTVEDGYQKGCYIGRGPFSMRFNYNYGPFSKYLNDQGITHEGEMIDLLKNPNLLITKTDPPLSVLSALWYYMTPFNGNPSMHEIVIGNWVSPDPDYAAGVFGPTSIIVGGKCEGESAITSDPLVEGVRIKAFKWLTSFFGAPYNKGDDKTLSCANFNGGHGFTHSGKTIFKSWDVDWCCTENPPCTCKMVTYIGYVLAYDPQLFPHRVSENSAQKALCEEKLDNGWWNLACATYSGK